MSLGTHSALLDTPLSHDNYAGYDTKPARRQQRILPAVSSYAARSWTNATTEETAKKHRVGSVTSVSSQVKSSAIPLHYVRQLDFKLLSRELWVLAKTAKRPGECQRPLRSTTKAHYHRRWFVGDLQIVGTSKFLMILKCLRSPRPINREALRSATLESIFRISPKVKPRRILNSESENSEYS